MDKHTRTLLRKDTGRYGWALLIYYLLLNYAVSMTAEIHLLYEGFRAVVEADQWDAFAQGVTNATARIMENGWGYLIACTAAVAAILLWKGKDFFKGIFEPKQTMTGGSFLRLLCIFLSGQLVFQLLAIVEEMLLNLLGLWVLESMEMASAGADTFSMFLYMGLGAPVVEEIIFRGVVMRGLEPHGKRFAIMASAVLFGLFHGNLVQSPYAFAVGLILGYTAMEYSVWWAMVLHMVNNLILGDSLLRLTFLLQEGLGDLLYWGIYLLCGIASIVILVRSRKAVGVWLRENPSVKGAMGAFFSTPSIIVLLILMGANAVLMLVV